MAPEQSASPIATGGDEVKISSAVVSDAAWSASGICITEVLELSVTGESGIEVRGAHSSKTATSGAASAGMAREWASQPPSLSMQFALAVRSRGVWVRRTVDAYYQASDAENVARPSDPRRWRS